MKEVYESAKNISLGRCRYSLDAITGELLPPIDRLLPLPVLLEDARLIIMDEPTTALTQLGTNIFLKLSMTLKGGISILFVSHKLNE